MDENLGLTYDPVEHFPARLSEHTLGMVGGDSAKNLRIAEARLITDSSAH